MAFSATGVMGTCPAGTGKAGIGGVGAGGIGTCPTTVEANRPHTATAAKRRMPRIIAFFRIIGVLIFMVTTDSFGGTGVLVVV